VAETPITPKQIKLEHFKARLLLFLICAIVILVASIIGLDSRVHAHHYKRFYVNTMGDTMWTLAFFAFYRFVFYRAKLWFVALITLDWAFFIETSQLWHPHWLDVIRSYKLGGMLLGFGFRWQDLICDAGGVLLGLFIFWCLQSKTEYQS